MLVTHDPIAGGGPVQGPLLSITPRHFVVVLDQVVPAMDIAMMVEDFAPGSTVEIFHDLEDAEAAVAQATPDVAVLGIRQAVEAQESLATRAAAKGAALIFLDHYRLPDLPEATRIAHAIIPFNEESIRAALIATCA